MPRGGRAATNYGSTSFRTSRRVRAAAGRHRKHSRAGPEPCRRSRFRVRFYQRRGADLVAHRRRARRRFDRGGDLQRVRCCAGRCSQRSRRAPRLARRSGVDCRDSRDKIMSAIETGTYTDFSMVVHGRAEPMRVPVNGTIEVSHRCPLQCKHCYNNLPMNDFVARARELTLDDYKRLLDELADLGCLLLLFSGGEILARRDLLDSYAYAKRKGFLITLFTNGTMITEKIADFLADLRPFTIEITLYGGTKETYENLTGIPGSYERCLRGMDLLLERNLPLKLKTVALSITKHEIPLMKQMAADRGVEFTFDAMINPRIDCSSSPLAVRLTPSEIVELDLDDTERVSEWRRLARDFQPPVYVEGESRQIYGCGGGINSFAIDPYG